jgi:uncharacterized protein YkwD
MKRIVGVMVLVVLVLVGIIRSQPNHQAQAEAGQNELEVIAQINAHRLGLGLQPLVINSTLEFLAKKQAEFGQAQNFEPPNYDWHRDANGEYPRQRGVRAGWSTYGGNPQKIEISENAGLGSLAFSMNYWRTSDIHRRTMENPQYREVGAWSISHPYGFLYMIVFGARPNLLPVPFNPLTCELYLPRDFSSDAGTWIRQVQTVQFFTQDNIELTPVLEYQPRMSLPRNVPEVFTVAMTEDNIEVRQTVKLAEDTVILPETLDRILGRSANTHTCTDPAAVVEDVIPTPIVLEATPTALSLEVAVAPTATPTSVRHSSEVTYPTATPIAASLASSELVFPTGTPVGIAFAASPTLASPATTVALANNPSAAITTSYPSQQPNTFPAVPAVIGTVAVNAGANLHCREYPFATARSLALIPNDTQLLIIGIPGPRDPNGQAGGFRDAPQLALPDYSPILEEAIGPDYFDTSAAPIQTLWLNAQWWANGTITSCWVNAGYMTLLYGNKSLSSTLDYLALVDRGVLVLVPYNIPGLLVFQAP